MLIEPFNSSDISEVNRLQPSDWNGVAAHYNYYLTHDNCVPLKITIDGVVRAIGTLIYHQDSAWLAHIITDKTYRGKGLGKTITQALLDHVNPEFFSTVYLMSTELGYPIYKSLGFVEEGLHYFYLTDMEAIDIEPNPHIQPIHSTDYPKLFELDALTYGEKRTYRLLQKIESTLVYKKDEELLGFYMPDLLEGPIIAKNEEAGKALMLQRMKSFSTAIVPDANIVANNLLKSYHWKVFRSARRMRLGAQRPWNPQNIYNRFSGQIG